MSLLSVACIYMHTRTCFISIFSDAHMSVQHSAFILNEGAHSTNNNNNKNNHNTIECM